MLRTIIQLMLLLIVTMSHDFALANVPQATYPRLPIETSQAVISLPAQSTSGIVSNYNRFSTTIQLASSSNGDWDAIGYIKQPFYKKGYVVYSQTLLPLSSKEPSADPKNNRIHTVYTGGRGNPDQILHQDRKNIKYRQDLGYSPPKVIQYHSHETAATTHVHELREQDKKAGYQSGYAAPEQPVYDYRDNYDSTN